ncbi:MAG: DegT/DnrJ/EryC1/StrS family aminotransferase [Ignavibacteriales bacterium]
MKNIPIMIPYFSEDEISNIADVLKSGWVAQGPKVTDFENAVAAHEKVGFGIGTTSCTTALHLALVAMGIGEGDDVIVPSFTFIATANAVTYTGATPILVDIDENTFNISIQSVLKKIEEGYTRNSAKNVFENKKTGNALKAIIPVHLFGLCANIPEINRIAQEYKLLVLEDAACALGAKIGEIHQGGFGNPSCLSFHPRKSITTGEGGMVLTDNKELADRIKILRTHGASVSAANRHKKGGYLLPDFDELGFNYRMTDIQAAVGIAQIKKFDWITEERRKKVRKYNNLLKEIAWIKTPTEPEGYFHTYQSYVCMINTEALRCKTTEDANEFRNQMMEKLEENGIATRQGTHAVHLLNYYKNKYNLATDYCINAYKADKLSLTLPLYVQMNDDDQEYVVDNIKKITNQFEGR